MTTNSIDAFKTPSLSYAHPKNSKSFFLTQFVITFFFLSLTHEIYYEYISKQRLLPVRLP